MRWDDLFADLGAQWDAQVRRELDGEVADRTRRERARVGLAERLAGAPGEALELSLCVVGRLAGRLVDVGDGWLLLATEGGGPALVPFSAITGVTGLAGLPVRVEGRRGAGRFGLGYAVRGLSRDRATVLVTTLDGGIAGGTIDAVGRDVLELAEHPTDLPRRAENVTGRRLVPFSALVLLRPGRQAGTRWDQS